MEHEPKIRLLPCAWFQCSSDTTVHIRNISFFPSSPLECCYLLTFSLDSQPGGWLQFRHGPSRCHPTHLSSTRLPYRSWVSVYMKHWLRNSHRTETSWTV